MKTARIWLRRALLCSLVLVLLVPSVFMYGLGAYAFLVLPMINRSFPYFQSLEAFAFAGLLLASGWGLGAVLWLVFFHHRRTVGQMPVIVRCGLVVGTLSLGAFANWVTREPQSGEEWACLSVLGGGPFVLMVILFARMQPSDKFECLLPPPFVAAVVAFVMMLFARALPAAVGLTMGPSSVHGVLSGLLATLGVAVAAAGVLAFKQAHTTVNPLNPENATVLVTVGVYQYSRNPMYLGLCLLLLAWAFWLAHWAGFLGPILFVAYITRFQIRPEERALRRLFTHAYERYSQRVRRWM